MKKNWLPALLASWVYASTVHAGYPLELISSDSKFLPADQVFALSAEEVDATTIRARWDITEGYYLYRDKLAFELREASGVTLATITLPPGETKVDEYFGNMEIYRGSVEIMLSLLRTDTTPTEFILIAKYQGCADAGFCYPPQTKSIPISLPAMPAPTSNSPSTTTTTSEQRIAGEQYISESDRLSRLLTENPLWLSMIIFFGLGIGLAFTPCVLPMVPILSSIIVGQGRDITTRKAFTISLVYVLAMALTYTIAGVIAGLFGQNLQAIFQEPWIIGAFAAIFILLALSMFGLYELQIPSFIQSKLTEISNRQQGGKLLGVGIMGFLSALIVGPCVAAPLAASLIVIGQTGDPFLGGATLFSLSLGMGVPLLVIGTSAGKILPRTGDWMQAIKAVFGVLLIAVAIWMLERILSATTIMLLWAALLIVTAIYLGALEPYGAGATGWRKLWKGTGLIMLVYGIVLIVGAASGGKDWLQPLERLTRGGSTSTIAAIKALDAGTRPGSVIIAGLSFQRIKGRPDLDRELATASAQGKPVMLDFYADWCVSCKEMERYTFSDPRVQAVLAQAVLLQADVTLNDAIDQKLLKSLNVFGPPSILFFGPDGQERRQYRQVGFLKAEPFRKLAAEALGGS